MPVTITIIITSSIGIMMIIIIVLQFELLLAKKKRCQFGSKRKKTCKLIATHFKINLKPFAQRWTTSSIWCYCQGSMVWFIIKWWNILHSCLNWNCTSCSYCEVMSGERESCHTPSGNWSEGGIFKGGIIKNSEAWGANGKNPLPPLAWRDKGRKRLLERSES